MARRDPLAARIAALDALAKQAGPVDIPPLREALRDRSSLLVAAAARVIKAHRLTETAPDLASALDRHYEAADPQCRAKHALLSALIDLDHADGAMCVRAAGHFQPEPGWGGSRDSAGPLRILGLEGLTARGRPEVHVVLADLLADPLAEVRSAAAKVAADIGGDRAGLLLRLRLRLGDEEEPANLGDYAAGLLAVDGEAGLPVVATLLQRAGRAAAGPLALALGASRLPGALPVLTAFLEGLSPHITDEDLVTAIALHRSEAAATVLLGLLEEGRRGRLAAQELRFYRDRAEVVTEVQRRVTGRPDLEAIVAGW